MEYTRSCCFRSALRFTAEAGAEAGTRGGGGGGDGGPGLRLVWCWAGAEAETKAGAVGEAEELRAQLNLAAAFRYWKSYLMGPADGVSTNGEANVTFSIPLASGPIKIW